MYLLLHSNSGARLVNTDVFTFVWQQNMRTAYNKDEYELYLVRLDDTALFVGAETQENLLIITAKI